MSSALDPTQQLIHPPGQDFRAMSDGPAFKRDLTDEECLGFAIARDKQDMKALRLLLAATLSPDSNCVEIGTHTLSSSRLDKSRGEEIIHFLGDVPQS